MEISECRMIRGTLVINGQEVDPPTPSKNLSVTQANGKIYVNGYEWTGSGWKRSLRGLFYHLFC